MKLHEAIELVDRLKPNQYDDEDKVRWISELDGVVNDEIIKRHEACEYKDFTGYHPDADMGTELLIPFPYDEIYRWYLEMKIDDANGEIVRYNNSAAKYNNYYQAFVAWYGSKHTPLQQARFIKI